MPALLIPIFELLAGSSGILSAGSIVKYIGLALKAINVLDGSDERLTAIHGQLKQMIAEKRDPTAAELDGLKARSDAAHARIQGG